MFIKRIIIFLLVFSMSFAFIACSDDEEESHIVGMSINTDGQLIVVWSNGTTENLGVVTGQDGQAGDDGQDGQAGDDGIGIVHASINALGQLVIEWSDGTMENLGVVIGQAGQDGDDGQDGQAGDDGQDGFTPHIGANGNWWINDIDMGIQAAGSTGLDGQAGEDGIGIVHASINELGQLVIEWSDGTTENLGAVVGQDGIGIVSMAMNMEGELIIELTDGSTLNAGKATHDYVGTYGLLFVAVHYEGLDAYVVSGYTGKDQDVTIPSSFRGKPVVGIIEEAFATPTDEPGRNVNIRSVVIPNTIKFIGDKAFHRSIWLQEVIFEEGSQLERIGNYAFQNAYILSTIDIPASVQSIGALAFANSFSLTSVTFEDASNIEFLMYNAFIETPFWDNQEGLVMIGKFLVTYAGEMEADKIIVIPNHIEVISPFALFEQANLIYVHIPASVKHIGQSAFELTTSLATVEFGVHSNLETISTSAFYESGITSIHIPASVMMIDSYAFTNTFNLSTVTFEIDSQLQMINWYTFQNSALTSIHIPARTENIGALAFSHTSNLSTVTFEENSQLKHIGHHAFYLSALTSFTIPKGVQHIPIGVFLASSLQTLFFEEGSQLKRIDSLAFTATLLTSVELPLGLEHIGRQAFECLSLVSIILPGTLTYIGDSGILGSEDLVITIALEPAVVPTTWHVNWNPEDSPIVWDANYYD